MYGDTDAAAQQRKVIDCITGLIKVKLVYAKAWLSTTQPKPIATRWIALVMPCEGQKEPEGGKTKLMRSMLLCTMNPRMFSRLWVWLPTEHLTMPLIW